MTVGDLIEKLQKMDYSLPVSIQVEFIDAIYLGYASSVVVDEKTYTGGFDKQTQKGIYEKTVKIMSV